MDLLDAHARAPRRKDLGLEPGERAEARRTGDLGPGVLLAVRAHGRGDERAERAGWFWFPERRAHRMFQIAQFCGSPSACETTAPGYGAEQRNASATSLDTDADRHLPAAGSHNDANALRFPRCTGIGVPALRYGVPAAYRTRPSLDTS